MGRPPQHVLAVARAHEVREVGVTARELLDHEIADIAEMRAQIRAEARKVELLAGTHGAGLIDG